MLVLYPVSVCCRMCQLTHLTERVYQVNELVILSQTTDARI